MGCRLSLRESTAPESFPICNFAASLIPNHFYVHLYRQYIVWEEDEFDLLISLKFGMLSPYMLCSGNGLKL